MISNKNLFPCTLSITETRTQKEINRKMFFPGRRRLNFLSRRKKDDAKNLFIAALANIILCFVNWQKIVTTSHNPEISAVSGDEENY